MWDEWSAIEAAQAEADDADAERRAGKHRPRRATTALQAAEAPEVVEEPIPAPAAPPRPETTLESFDAGELKRVLQKLLERLS